MCLSGFNTSRAARLLDGSHGSVYLKAGQILVGLFFQQAIALFVLKSGAGFKIFSWLANLASDFLAQGLQGAAFFFDPATVANNHWFFVNTVSILHAYMLAYPHKNCLPALFDHFLHCIRSNALLHGCHAMAHQGLVRNSSSTFRLPKTLITDLLVHGSSSRR